MIIDFTIKNFRSFRDEVTLSLEASGSKGKSDNVVEVTLKNGKKYKLLKTAVIYGGNASGKSNVIRAYWSFRKLISTSFKFDVNDEFEVAEPFELDQTTQNQPTEFTLNYIGWDNLQYVYYISISKNEGVIEETLKYYPEKISKLIYRRKGRKILKRNPDIFTGEVAGNTINPKRLYLSELGNSGNEYWEKMRNYFVLGNSVVNFASNGMQRNIVEKAKQIFESTDPKLIKIRNRAVRLIQLSDLGIKDLNLVEEEQILKPSISSEELPENYSGTIKQKRFKTYHEVYKNDKVVDKKQFDLLKNGSTGTISLVGLSAEILYSLSFIYSRPIWIDEIDNSMHPYLCRFIISLFKHPKSNPYNTQLIFATHETTLLDKNNFRKDQIWITSKDKYGCSKLYSVYDLELDGLRDEIPFDKWYLSGKFGGVPKIKELDFIFDRKDTNSNGKKAQ